MSPQKAGPETRTVNSVILATKNWAQQKKTHTVIFQALYIIKSDRRNFQKWKVKNIVLLFLARNFRW